MPGHVFVVQGDLTHLKCDDVFVPTDASLHVTRGFRDLLGGAADALPPIPRDWLDPIRRPLLVPHTPGDHRVWLVNTASPFGDVEWLMSGISSAIAHVSGQPATTSRARRLIGLPLVGVGDGGFASRRAEVIKGLLDVLRKGVQPEDAPDVALVLLARSDYAVIQRARTEDDFPGSVLRHEPEMRLIADKARNGDLVLFLGAGVSIAAGLPSWGGLLGQLGKRAGFTQNELDAVLELPAPDAATVIERQLPTGSLADALRELLPAGPHALAHALLGSLRVREAITTNYDSMYERAAHVPFGEPVVVLPRERAVATRPWLLKLHGDLDDPNGTLVLTREHYLRFASDRAPLAAMVQSRLLTSHVLFVGYSLIDENFVRLAHEVRQLFTSSDQRSAPLGTVLTLVRDRARERLWHGDLTYVAMSGETVATVDDLTEAARTLEVLLDYTAWLATDEPSFLLDTKYRALLEEGDSALAQALEQLAGHVARGPTASRYWLRVTRLLREFGHDRGDL